MILEAAKHLHQGVLSKKSDQPSQNNYRLNQNAVYLLEDDKIAYSSDIQDQIASKKIKKTIFRPSHGLLTSMIGAALAPVTIQFYKQIDPNSALSKVFSQLSREDVSKLQLMLLFCELGFGFKDYFKQVAAEYQHYCLPRKIYSDTAKLQEDLQALEDLDKEVENPSAKTLLMRQVRKHFTTALYLYDQDLSLAFSDIAEEVIHDEDSEAIKKAKKGVIGQYLHYLGRMLEEVGLHQACFINNLSQLLNRECTLFDKKMFDFEQGSDLSVLLAFKALNQIPNEDFTVKIPPPNKAELENIALPDASFSDFSPTAVYLKNLKKNHKD